MAFSVLVTGPTTPLSASRSPTLASPAATGVPLTNHRHRLVDQCAGTGPFAGCIRWALSARSQT